MAGDDLGLNLIETPQREPCRSVRRALAYGCLAGVCAAMTFFFSFLDPSQTVSELIAALAAGALGEFVAGLVLVAIGLAIFLTIGLLVSMPTAFPFIVCMAWIEPRLALSSRIWVWGLLGAIFSIPVGIWLASIAPPFGGPFDMSLFFLNVLGGSIGGLAAWHGYYRPVRSVP